MPEIPNENLNKNQNICFCDDKFNENNDIGNVWVMI